MNNDNSELISALIKNADKAFNNDERTNAVNQWSDISHFILNNQSGVFHGETSRGHKKTSELFDGTAIQANYDLGAFIHSTVANPATKWIKLRYKDDDLNNIEEATAFLERSNDVLLDQLNQSNFDASIAKVFQSLPALATAVLLHDVGTDTLFNFTTLHLSEVAFSENIYGIVDTLYRKFKMTGRQVMEKFPDVSADMKRQIEQDGEKEFNIIHCIKPRAKKEVQLNEFGIGVPSKRPFACHYICTDTKELLHEDGYYEFPVYVVRWSTAPREVYGRGLGHLALPDIRTVNKYVEFAMKASEKMLFPPTYVEQRAILGDLDSRPGKLNIVRDINGIKESTPTNRLDVAENRILQLQDSIRRCFLIDKIMLPPRTSTGEMSAYEVSVRNEQMQRVLGPTVSRFDGDLFTPLVVRAFNMMLRHDLLESNPANKLLPPIPEVVSARGAALDIEFVNPLARNQKFEDVTNIQAWVQECAQLAQLNPQALDYIDADAIVKYIAKIRHIPEIAVTNDKDVEAIRKQRQQMQTIQQGAELGVQAADIRSKLGGNNGQ